MAWAGGALRRRPGGGGALAFGLTLVAGLAMVVGCAGSRRDDDTVDTVRVTGSDTMVNLAQAWVEAFNRDHPDISIPVKGGGSGVGIAALCAGKIEIATASRPMKPKEIELAEKNTGKKPKEFIVGRDALAIYVNEHNPLESISIEELAEIYGEGGKITQLEGTGRRERGLPERRDHSRQPAEQLGHVRLFQRGRAGQGARVQAGRHGAKRLVGRRGAGLARRPARSATAAWAIARDDVKVAQGVEDEGRRRASSRRWPRPATAAIRSRGRCTSTRWASRPARCRSSSSGSVGDEGQKIVEQQGYVPVVQAAPAD